MYIHYDPVTAYSQHFGEGLHYSRDAALIEDFRAALAMVKAGSHAMLETAARTGQGTLYEALEFLVACGHDMRDIAERENTPAAKEESAS